MMLLSIRQRLDRCWNTAAETDERLAGTGIADFDHRRGAEQSAEIDDVTGMGPRYGNQPCAIRSLPL
jgi:hypothetical protein